MKYLSGLLFFSLLFVASAFGQIYDPVKWSTEYKQVNDQEFDLIFTANIQDGWSIYSQYLENDDGPVKTSFEFDAGDHYQLVGKNEETGGRKEGYDKLFDMNVIKFTKKAVFTQRIKVSDFAKPVSGYLEFMTCDATKCLPPAQEDFEFKLPAKKTSKASDTGAVSPPKTEESKTVAKVEEKKPIEKTTNKTSPPTVKKEEKATTSLTTTPETAKEEPKEQIVEKPVVNTNTSGILDPVKWAFEVKKTADKEFDLIFTAKIDKGWYIYSQELDGEDGPIPTQFYYDEDPNVSLVGKTSEAGPKRVKEFDRNFDMTLIKYKEAATFTQHVKVADVNKVFKGEFEFMTCEAGRCLPPALVPFKANWANLSTLIGDEAEEPIASTDPVTTADPSALVNIQGNVIDQAIPSIQSTYVNPVGNCGREDTAVGQSLIWTFILGFMGGLVALLTPCVFPMIPLTVSFFTKGSDSKAKGIRNGLIYGLSIIVIYVAIGLFITAAFGATALNELSTNWIANTLFFLIFVAFAISFFGYYEITLPSSWSTKSDAMADKGGLIGTFFMAFTLALVSFSCTGPIIGSAIVQSATDPLGPFIVMLGFSTALALPFGFFAAFPAVLNTLPRSGSWMNSVKVVLGFLELALALKFLSVADMTMHWNILGYELFMGLWIIIFAGMTLYLFGYIKFPHDSPLKKLSPVRWGFALTSLATTIYLCTGFFFNDKTQTYNSLSLMSGLAPPAHYNYLLPEPSTNKSIKDKYPSFTKCANNLDCFKDYYDGLAYAKETNKPILLDFTGYGCVNCRKTEEHIWVADQVWNRIAEDFVLISLYVDDRKALDDILVSKSTNKKIRNIGNKWADFQIVNFEQNSQPLYVMMSPEQKVLAKPRGYKEGIDDYAEFLECGLSTYKNISLK